MGEVLLGPGQRPLDEDHLPAGWRAVQLGRVCRIVGGGRLGLTKQKDYRPTGVPAFSASGPDGFVEPVEITGSGVVLAAIGVNCGRCFYASGEWTTLGNVQVLLPDPKQLDGRLLFHRVNRPGYWPRSGSAQPFIKPSDIRRCWLALPPLGEQRRIVEILDDSDQLTQQTDLVAAKLQRIRDGLERDLLTLGLDETSLVRRVVLPRSRERLLNHVSLPCGQVDPRAEQYPHWLLVAPDHLESGTGRLLARQTAAEQGVRSGKYRFQAGDVLYSKIRPHLRKAVLAEESGLCSADMYPLRPRPTLLPRFLLALLLGEAFTRFAVAVSMRSGFPKINRQELGEFVVALPPVAEQERIVALLLAQDARLELEQAYRTKLVLQSDGLAVDLLSGKRRL